MNNNYWIETYTGKKFPLFDFDESDIDIVDIAHALSMQCRYNGHVKRFYSVAEHCILLTEYVLDNFPGNYKAALAALLHDAAETYLGDMVGPIKPVFHQFSWFEANLLNCIYHKFIGDFSASIRELIHDLDVRIRMDEKHQLLGALDWGISVPALGVKIESLDPGEAKRKYIKLFYELQMNLIDQEK